MEDNEKFELAQMATDLDKIRRRLDELNWRGIASKIRPAVRDLDQLVGN